MAKAIGAKGRKTPMKKTDVRSAPKPGKARALPMREDTRKIKPRPKKDALGLWRITAVQRTFSNGALPVGSHRAGRVPGSTPETLLQSEGSLAHSKLFT